MLSGTVSRTQGAARPRPGDTTGAATTGGMGQIALEMLKRAAGVENFRSLWGDAPGRLSFRQPLHNHTITGAFFVV